MTELGGGINELNLDLFESGTRCLREERLAQSDDALLGTRAASLDHHVILLHLTIVRESSHGSDVLLGDIKVGGGEMGGITLDTDAVHLLVHFGTVIHTHGTGAGNSPPNASRMPSANARHLAETTMRLAGETGDAPTGDNTFGSVASGDGDGVNHLGLGEDGGDGERFLEEACSKVDLVSHGATVDLDFHDVGLLLRDGHLGDLGVGNDTDDTAVLFDLLEFSGDFLAAVSVLLCVLGESLLL